LNGMSLDDYYLWYCDWCDSRNLTLLTSFDDGKVSCGACHQSLAIPSLPAQMAPATVRICA
jgi:hypothetical protein